MGKYSFFEKRISIVLFRQIPARVARPFVIQDGPTSGRHLSSSEGHHGKEISRSI